MLDAGRKIERSSGSDQRGLRREVVTDQTVVVIMRRTVVVMLVRFSRLRMSMIGRSRVRMMMAAAMSMTMRPNCSVDMVRPLEGMHPRVAEERNPAVNGEQTPANQCVDAGSHQSRRQAVDVSGRTSGTLILSDAYARDNPDSGAIRTNSQDLRTSEMLRVSLDGCNLRRCPCGHALHT